MSSLKSGFGLFLVLTSSSLFAQASELYSGMSWRLVGPWRGGRSLAVAGSDQRPSEYYFGATGGGVWKTTDAGVNWKPVSDGFLSTGSVGALAIAPSNPDVVYAGTGERDIRGDISHGDGLYRSSDAGKTWQRIGLEQTQTISRIVVHPTNADVIWVAALGHIYGKDPNRGVYKSTDGGKTWQKVLDGTNQAGTVDIALDASNPDVLLASNWEAYRTPFSMVSGGPGSGLYKTTNGGESWTDISRNSGLPGGVLGKIGVSISTVDSKRYWAMVEAEQGGLFCSDDAGATWKKVNEDRNWRQRAWYYTHVYADTKDKETVYVLNVGMGKSTNGGKSFTSLRPPHGDNHDLWIASNDPKRMIEANDGGACVSNDGGQTWTSLEIPTGQFYHVSTDNAFPYNILGAQQDNSTVRIASRSFNGSITIDDWTSTAGGESGYVAAKPDNPDLVFGGSYGGDLSWFNHRTKESRAVDPWPDNPMGHGAVDLEYRFQWTYPIVFSRHDPNVLFTCSQYVMMTNDLGQSWKKISPDLTKNDKSTMQSSGGPLTKDNTSVEYYGTVFSIAESPKRKGVMWAGSDDGLVHVTQDGGKTWKNITPPDMPKWGLVSTVEASPHDPATAYLAIDNHENDDYAPYAYKTTDFGATWTKITNGFDKGAFLRVIREDPKQKGLLYAGTEVGVYISFNDGATWRNFQLNLPVTPVHDMTWKDNDLVLATHGRGFWVLDDVTPLQQIAKNAASETRLFEPRDAIPVNWGGRGPAGKNGANPPGGLILNYYLAKNTTDLKFEISDAQGKVLQTISGPKTAGFQRISTFLQYSSFTMLPGMILWAGFPQPIVAPPGTYTVTMIADGVKKTSKFRWTKDPRTSATDADLQEKFRFQMEIVAKINVAHQALTTIKKLREDRGSKASADWQKELTEVEEAIYQTKNRSGQDPLNYPIRLNDKLAGVFSNVSGGNYRPTKQAYEVFSMLAKQLDAQLAKLAKLSK